MKLKICGMKYHDNILDAASLRPDYIGLIFHEKSPRFVDHDIPKIPDGILKVGVFVDAPIEKIIDKIDKYGLKAIQLHGHETPETCRILRSSGVIVIKVFSIKDKFDFSVLDAYEDVCDFYLFDTKGTLPGGNGYAFDWQILNGYPSSKPYFLSGGIGPDQLENLKAFTGSDASRYCEVIDVNSKFETEPAKKDIESLKAFKNQL